MSTCWVGGGGGIPIFLNFNIFGGFQKNEYWLGYEDFDISFGSSHNWTLFRGHFYAFSLKNGSFLKVKLQKG